LGANDVKSSSYALAFEQGDLFGDDKLTMSVSQPNRVESGSVTVRLTNLSDSEGNLTYSDQSVPLSPSGRQVDIGIAYDKKLGKDWAIRSKIVATKDKNHVEDGDEVISGFVGVAKGGFRFGLSSASDAGGADSVLSYTTNF